MAQYTKQQLSASNAASFPDNTTGYITPELLRYFNTASIDSYAILSGSNTFVGNQVITGSVTATSFTGSFLGNLVGTASWANNSTTASHALTSVSASYALNSTSASYALNATSASYAVNATSASFASTASFVQNAQTASFVLNAVSASFSNFATSASYASASTSASYALVAESANTIGSTTVNGVQTYTYSQNKISGTNWNYTKTQKFITGSFSVVSESYTRFMSVGKTGADSGSWKGTCVLQGSTTANTEFAIASFGAVLRAGNASIFQLYTDPAINAATNGIARPEFSASWNSGTNVIDFFARTAFNLTSSMIVEATFNLAQSGSVTPSSSLNFTFY